mmetsp:Transcript_2043/g.5762  ORF Transcript_2043/g.5762 Transcript_2043/m.5762 type:complete len:452 (-) Transcript_2043:54-1409(-)
MVPAPRHDGQVRQTEEGYNKEREGWSMTHRREVLMKSGTQGSLAGSPSLQGSANSPAKAISDQQSAIASDQISVSRASSRLELAKVKLGEPTSSSMIRLKEASKPAVKAIFGRSTSAMSRLSNGTSATDKSAVPSDLDIEETRPAGGIRVDHSRLASHVYEFREKLGQGGFGQVWLCRRIGGDQLVAIKRIPQHTIRDMQRFQREIRVFERLSNPYIVKLHEVYQEHDQLHMVMDLCNGGDLAQYLWSYWSELDDNRVGPPPKVLKVKGLPYKVVGSLLWQMLAGIAYMHHHRYMHRDIKLENYMLKDARTNSKLQLVDFGLSTPFKKGQKLAEVKGTPAYMAPEVMLKSYNEKCDIWSIGIVCYILCVADIPWDDGYSKDMKFLVVNDVRTGDLEITPELPREMVQLINQLMQRNPMIRPGAKDIIRRDDWLRQFSRRDEAGKQKCCTIS